MAEHEVQQNGRTCTKAWRKSLPIGRVGELHGIAQAYLFLMQEGLGTGQTVVVDGGTLLV